MENIVVCVRVRPLTKDEAAQGTPWKLTSNTITLCNVPKFTFDSVFDTNSKTSEVYNAHPKNIIVSTVQGFNGTILAYGQTSSGKTFTMQGSTEEPGIIPLAIQDVFQITREENNREFVLRVSYMEIYNDELVDLLAPENCKLQVHENLELGFFVAGLREEIVVTPEHVLALMEYGEAHRHIGKINMNADSSRSHTIFRLAIESREKSQDASSDRVLQASSPLRVSHLNLIDLAGSERICKSGAEGTRLKEGTYINKSLMALGTVINKLSEGIEKQGGHVPYRNSKLTRILQPALGGNAKTVIICNITPALVHVNETRSTLQFASRAKRVTNCAQVNEILTDAALLKRQKLEIAQLREKLHNQEFQSEYFEEQALYLRAELLKTELERERMMMELQEFQNAEAERERRIKEQEEKISELLAMVNSTVHDYDAKQIKGKRCVSCCPGHKDLDEPSDLDLSRIPSSIPLNGLPSGIPMQEEALLNLMLPHGTFTEYSGCPSMGDCTHLPEPVAESYVADCQRMANKVVNKVDKEAFGWQAEHEHLHCESILKMEIKDAEVELLGAEFIQFQQSESLIFEKDMHRKSSPSVELRGKDLVGSVIELVRNPAKLDAKDELMRDDEVAKSDVQLAMEESGKTPVDVGTNVKDVASYNASIEVMKNQIESLLPGKLQEQGLSNKTDVLSKTIANFDSEQQESTTQMSESQQEIEGESSEQHSVIAILCERCIIGEVSLHSLVKERDRLWYDLEETKAKLQEAEAKVVTILEDKDGFELSPKDLQQLFGIAANFDEVDTKPAIQGKTTQINVETRRAKLNVLAASSQFGEIPSSETEEYKIKQERRMPNSGPGILHSNTKLPARKKERLLFREALSVHREISPISKNRRKQVELYKPLMPREIVKAKKEQGETTVFPLVDLTNRL